MLLLTVDKRSINKKQTKTSFRKKKKIEGIFLVTLSISYAFPAIYFKADF